jgi:4,5-DOPA dioxygenase extradiol
MNSADFLKSIRNEEPSNKMPVLFIGHGNPMNAITDNRYTQSWNELGKLLVRPKAILCISAHWLTRGTYVTMAEIPKTIHDFGGFPEELYKQQYPAPGAVDYARSTIESVRDYSIMEDHEWGLDHGTWSILMNMYPLANIPVYQLSIDFNKTPEYHFELGRELTFLRNKGVLIIASGNIVHNLRQVKWSGYQKPYDWAIEFDNFVKKKIENADSRSLIEYQKLGHVSELAQPTNDHYLPLLYAAGLREKKDSYHFFNDSFDMGSMSMRSVIFG